MPISRSQKEGIVKNLKEKIAKSRALVLARFHGLSVAKISEFRRKMRAEGGEYSVAKKSLLKIALKDIFAFIELVLVIDVALKLFSANPLAAFL